MGVEHYIYNDSTKTVFSLGKLIGGNCVCESTPETLEQEVLWWWETKYIDEIIDTNKWAKDISQNILSTVGCGDSIKYFTDNSDWEHELEKIKDYVVVGSVYGEDAYVGKTVYDLFCPYTKKVKYTADTESFSFNDDISFLLTKDAIIDVCEREFNKMVNEWNRDNLGEPIPLGFISKIQNNFKYLRECQPKDIFS